MARIRADDNPPASGWVLRREVPAWGLVLLVIAFGGQAIGLWGQFQSLSTSLTTISAQQVTMTAVLGEITRSLNSGNLKDLEHDLKIQSLTNRVAALEAVLQRTAPGSVATQK